MLHKSWQVSWHLLPGPQGTQGGGTHISPISSPLDVSSSVSPANRCIDDNSKDQRENSGPLCQAAEYVTLSLFPLGQASLAIKIVLGVEKWVKRWLLHDSHEHFEATLLYLCQNAKHSSADPLLSVTAGIKY